MERKGKRKGKIMRKDGQINYNSHGIGLRMNCKN